MHAIARGPCGCVVWCLAAGVSQAAPPAALPLPHCEGGPALTLPQAPAVTLDEDDSAAVWGQALARYPALQQHGVHAQRVLMWRAGSGDWRYAALSRDEAGRPCFTATVSAQALDTLTPRLRLKYFGRDA